MEPYFEDDSVTLYHGDALEVARELPGGSVDCIVTSPPYFGLRDYGEPGQYGLEASPAEYVETMRALFAELRRALVADGTLWLNLGDSYSGKPASGRGASSAFATRSVAARQGGGGYVSGLPDKNLIGIPWLVAFALQADGWILRNEIVWKKLNAMPESVRDRFSKRHEKVFLFSKSESYWFDLDAVRVSYSDNKPWGSPAKSADRPGAATAALRGHDPSQHQTGLATHSENPLGRNPGDVWEIPTTPFGEAHFAVMPPALAERCVMAGCKPGGAVLDPFSGSGTTGLAAAKHGHRYVGIDLNRDYLDLSLRTRLQQPGLDLGEVS